MRFSFWLTAFGGFLLYFSFIGGNGLYGAGNAPDVGWFAYAPLTSRALSVGHSTDFWTLGLLVSGFGSIGTAVNFIATILCMRCPGMTLNKMPLFTWMNLVMAGLVILAISPLTAAQMMLSIDRYLGGHFFDAQAGGSAALWMHFFWIFGHPEVYVLIIPAFAFASEIIPVFSRKPIFGYPVMVAATISIAFVSLSVWAHHMFTIGMTSYSNSFFTITTMVVGIPTGIKIFNWIGHNVGRQDSVQGAHAFLHRVPISVLDRWPDGNHAGASPFDWQLGNSYFVVAHFHYVIVGGILFAVFAAFYYWFPKMTGRMYNETLGKMAFLAVSHRFPPDFRFHAYSGDAGNAAPNIHVRTRTRLGTLEPDRYDRSVLSGIAGVVLFLLNLFFLMQREPRRKRPVGRLDSRMVGEFAAALPTTLLPSLRSPAGDRCGIRSIQKIRTVAMSKGKYQ